MQITIPKGMQLSQSEDNTIQIKIPNTKFWIIGEQKKNKKWDIFIQDKESKYKEKIKENITTKNFSLFSNIILKTQLPISKLKTKNIKNIIKLINKINKKQ